MAGGDRGLPTRDSSMGVRPTGGSLADQVLRGLSQPPAPGTTTDRTPPATTPGTTTDRTPPTTTVPGRDAQPPRTTFPGTIPGRDIPPATTVPRDTTTRPPAPTDRATGPLVRDGVLELSYRDATSGEFDRLMASARNFNTINIRDMPPGVSVAHWIDERGYFFHFLNGNDGSRRHYYPANTRSIAVGTANQNLTQERMRVHDEFAAQHGGFRSMERGTNVVNYLANMSRYGQDSLDIQARALEESARSSPNPYFKIYLADIYVAQAMKPIVDQMLRTGSANPNNPATLDRLNRALEQLQAAQRDSRGQLSDPRVNRFPPANAVMPMDPYSVFEHGPSRYFDFWGGSLDQARTRETAITLLRDMIKLNALPRMELPPALPQR